jgi:hypothetical protein
MPDQVTIRVTHGGGVRCVAPRCTDDRSLIFSLMVSASLHLQCESVLARHWLPGMHLMVQAFLPLQRPADVTMQDLAWEWPRMERSGFSWLDRSDEKHPAIVYLPSAFGSCCLVRARSMPQHPAPAFTFDIRWPLPATLHG